MVIRTSSTIFQRPGQPERAAAAQLHQIVEEADPGAGEHDEEHRQRLDRVLAEDEERDDRGDQEEHAAHHRACPA